MSVFLENLKATGFMALALFLVLIYYIITESPSSSSSPTISGGKSVRKIASSILNVDIVKSGYKAYKKIKG
jgi:hypothetical protein